MMFRVFRRTTLIAIAALTAIAISAPAVTAAPTTEGTTGSAARSSYRGYDPVGFSVSRELARASFSGELTWTGDGSYEINGHLSVYCQSTSRTTAWIQHAGASQSWKNTQEIECQGQSTNNSEDIHVTGKLTKHEDLYIRLGTWQSSFPAGTWKYSDIYKRDIFS
ncbi:hypothetical protein [Kitasatospora griseola]|uniref:hypothetical protein n=1 Tax=Kitasatospora griseola TaxID=2064 RepID=UPI0034390A27